MTGSLNQNVLESLTTGSYLDYKNLNIDYRYFNNHTTLGSAKTKLENFKTKVETIQSYYSQISQSLTSVDTSVKTFRINPDSTEVIQTRKNYNEEDIIEDFI